MDSKLTAKQRLKLVERALRGENISSLCKECGISRTLLYRWIERHKEYQKENKILALKPKKRHVPLSLRIPPDKIKLILDIVRQHPEFSVTGIIQALPKDSEGNSIVGYHGVQNVLERLDLNTIGKRQDYQKQPQILQDYKSVRSEILGLSPEELNPQDRLAMIERYKLGEPVARVCRIYGVSRTVFYRWLKRYEDASEGKKLEALWDKKPVVEKYFNQAPEEYEQAVLSAVREYPELSSHKLVHVLPKIGEKPILGNHGVQNVLARHGLTLYEKRLAYAQAYHQPTPFTRFFKVPRTALSYVGSLVPSYRKFVVRAGFVAGIGIFAGVVIYGAASLVGILTAAPTLGFSIGMIFSFLSLGAGMFFFLYSLKCYFTIAVVLSFSRRNPKEEAERSSDSLLANLFGSSDNRNNNQVQNSKQRIFTGGLQSDLSNISLQRKPFVSIQLATYNEKRVVERLLTAATSMEYENYEVILVDDSTDETMEILKKWEDHPRVKIIHRASREGFKGGALNVALKHTNPKTEFILVFDADFIPYPDTIVQFLKSFQSLTGSLEQEDLKNTKVAAIQGYQWHVLNKSENWVTRGVRSEYAGSYVIERSGIEIYQGLEQIAGSVYMLRADVLHQLGWGSSITEDFEFTLRLYERGYKVAYTPYIQAPAEAVSTIKRLIRQRMRWAEGHSFNVKKMFFRLLKSSKLTFAEKFEFLYLSPYYLQAALFIVGSLCWFLAEAVFRARLPFWTELWGWSLILTNMFALPLMNMVGLFLEESGEKDYLGLFSFVALSYIVAPFQGYAAVKGFLSEKEGPWFRTPKTGRITDIFTPGRFYRFISGVFGRPVPVPSAPAVSQVQIAGNPYLSFSSANNVFDNFAIPKIKHLAWVSRVSLAILLSLTVTLFYFSQNVELVYATQIAGPLKLGIGATAPDSNNWPSAWNVLQNGATYASGANVLMLNNGGTSNNYLWATTGFPLSQKGNNAIFPNGTYAVNLAMSVAPANANKINFAIQILATSNNGTGLNLLVSNTTLYVNNSAGTLQGSMTAVNTLYKLNIAALASNYQIVSPTNRLALRIYTTAVTNNSRTNISFVFNNTTIPASLVLPANIEVPEIPQPIVFIILIGIMPAIPVFMKLRLEKARRGRKSKGWKEDLSDFLNSLTGRTEAALDELPV